MTVSTPPVVTRYLRAAETRDPDACASCFTADGTVVDEGITHRGPAEIRRWREELLGQFTYTTTVTRTEAVDDRHFRVAARVEGNFPGGTADLTYDFTLDGDLIADLRIVG